MLGIELDIFSGMPNPTWLLPKRQEATLYELLSAEPNQISPLATSSRRLGLGYRGLIIRRVKTDEGVWDTAVSRRRTRIPNELGIGIKAARKDSAADWLVKTASPQGVRLANEMQAVVPLGVAFAPRSGGPVDPTAKIDRKRVEEAETAVDVPYKPGAETHETWWACGSNYFSANAHKSIDHLQHSRQAIYR